MALHAWRMAFNHPLSAAPLECIAELPDNLKGYIAAVDQKKEREFTSEQFEQLLKPVL